MDMTEKTLHSEELYSGKIVRLLRDRVLLPDGKEAVREVVRHAAGVAVLPLLDNGEAVMVSQYRYPFGEVLLEVPAGKLDEGEQPLGGALRELAEETGLRAGEMTYLGSVYPSPGCFDEELHIYLATGLTQSDASPDEDEFLSVERIPFSRLLSMVCDNTIKDAKTVVAVLRANAHLGAAR